MSEDRPTDLLSGLPRTRPHRRSEKRAAPSAPGTPGPAATPSLAGGAKTATRAKTAAGGKTTGGARTTGSAPSGRKPRSRPAAKTLRQPAQPRGIPKARRAPKRKPAPASRAETVGTAVQAVGELAELGLTLSARALRNAVARLPKP